ncbi:MAG TPA: MBL fold metallo-hydrolase [Chloroflexota bacterium]|nr:MBL fold metallo-hydrolase [Chloroflexota bacterium]
MIIDLQFLGAAGTVTGSRFMLRLNGRYILIDCGLFQGGRQNKEANWQPFPIQLDQIDAVILTHAHIDHTGYLPRLVQQGFGGPIYATEATCALLDILLPDSAHLHEQDAAYANKKGFSRHQPALPLYTTADAQETLRLLSPVQFYEPLQLNEVEVTWWPAGHLLGSAIVQVNLDGADGPYRLVFSGDLGRYDGTVMKPPASMATADTLIVESTYGGRRHSDDDIATLLAEVLDYITAREGVLLIPAFAVGRTQQVLYHLRRLQEAGRAPEIPIFIDSPMAVDASHIYCRFGDDHNLDVNLLMDEHACPLRCPDTHFVRDVEESKQLNTRPGPAIIISASGMCTGGRIKHHLKWRLPDPRNVVLLVGYQAQGTRGRWLLNGAKSIRIHGEEFPVRARIASLHALSGHAGHDELLRWLGGFERPPQQTFIVHGEPEASRALQTDLEKWSWQTTIPAREESYTLA